MPEKFSPQPTPENPNKELWLSELNSKKTRDLLLAFILSKKRLKSHEDAEDVVQKALLNAAKAIEAGQFRGEAKLGTWLCRIAENTALMLLRKQRSASRIETSAIDLGYEPIKAEPNGEESFIKDESMAELKENINKLNPKSKEIIELYLQGMDDKEIAEKLGITISKVKIRKFRARKLLAEQMRPEAGE